MKIFYFFIFVFFLIGLLSRLLTKDPKSTKKKRNNPISKIPSIGFTDKNDIKNSDQTSKILSSFDSDLESTNSYDPSLYWFSVEEMSRKINSCLTLNYKSTSGNITKRDVDVTAFYRGEGGCMFDCYCHLRKAKRTLSSKSVLSAIDRDTGEVIEDLCRYFNEKYDHNPEKAYDLILEKYAWAIFILSYVAGCDGAIRAPEWKMIAEFCQRRGNPAELVIDKLEAIAKNLGRPQKTDFHRFIREKTASPEIIKDIFETSQRVVALNSKAHTEQERAIAYMMGKWKTYL